MNIIDYGKEVIHDEAVSEIDELCHLLETCGIISDLVISDSRMNGTDLKLIADAVKTKSVYLYSVTSCSP